jgi:hypothetical protein
MSAKPEVEDERCWWPEVPVAHRALEQAITELDRQKRDGWHLIDVQLKAGVDECGRIIWQDAKYLETECPTQN